MIIEARGFGSTVDEAKENAIAELNAAEDADIQFEVIATPKKKTLGLFGGRRAEVRVFVELPDEKPKAQKKSVQNKPKAEKRQPKPTAKAKPEVDAEKKVDNDAQTEKSTAADGYGDAVDASEVAADSREGRAVSYLNNILAGLGCSNIKMSVATKSNAALIEVDGDGLGAVIGHRGETLDSVQYLTSLAAGNGSGYYKVTVNIGNYRQKREEALVSLAKRVSAQVLKTGRSRSLEPMNPYERRIIHTAVQEIDGVVSNSYGEGAARRVYIAVEGGDMRPPRRDRSKREGFRDRRAPSAQSASAQPAREPRRDSDTPLYGKIN